MNIGHHPPIAVSRDGETRIFGRRVFTDSIDSLLAKFSELLKSESPHVVVTTNVDHLIRLDTNENFRVAYDNADIITLDGSPLVKLAARLGAKSPSRITGADLIYSVADSAYKAAWRIAILGTQATVARAVTNLNSRIGHKMVYGVAFPEITTGADPAGFEKIQERLDFIRPSIVFVCIGSPKQEVWLSVNREKLPPAVYIGAGAAAEFASGIRRRAPRWVQNLSAEWLYRVAQEPLRLGRRYFVRGPRYLYLRHRSLNAKKRTNHD